MSGDSERPEPSDPVEREFKFRCDDLSRLRDQLVEADADRVSKSVKEENWVLDRGGALFADGRLLRIRSDPRGATLTLKGPAHIEAGAKVRSEREVEVDDYRTLVAIFEHLGYQVSKRYEKFRETWILGGVTVCLDRTPMGDFAEFEGSGAERLVARFGFDPAAAEASNYLALYEEYRREHPDAPEDMVFP